MEQRWYETLCDIKSNPAKKGCLLLYRAVKKYGANAFTKQVIATAISKKQLDALEIYFIKKYNSQKHGYNIRSGGSAGKPTLAGRLRMSAAQKLVALRPEIKLRNKKNGRRLSIFNSSMKGRAAASRRNKLRFKNPAERQRVSEQFKGTHTSTKVKELRSRLFTHDLTDQHFGLWLVIKRGPNGTRTLANPSGGTRWLCRCSCAAEHLVYAYNLKACVSTRCRACALTRLFRNKIPKQDRRSLRR